MNTSFLNSPIKIAATGIVCAVLMCFMHTDHALAADACSNMADYAGYGKTMATAPYWPQYAVPAAGSFGYSAWPMDAGSYGDLWGVPTDDSVFINLNNTNFKLADAGRRTDCPNFPSDVAVSDGHADLPGSTTGLKIKLSTGTVIVAPQGSAGASQANYGTEPALWDSAWFSWMDPSNPYDGSEPVDGQFGQYNPCLPGPPSASNMSLCQTYESVIGAPNRWYGAGIQSSGGPGSLAFADGSAKDVFGNTAEDDVIDDVQKTGHVTVQGTYTMADYTSGTYTTDTRLITVPASNCLPISGTGPNAIVFIRDGELIGSDVGSTVTSFLASVNQIETAISNIDPFKSYISQFSFYADLHRISTPSFLDPTTFVGAGGATIDHTIEQQTSCKGDVLDLPTGVNGDVQVHMPRTVTYVLLTPLSRSFASLYTRGHAYVWFANEGGDPSFGPLVVHEISHAFAGLKDEYIQQANGDFETFLQAAWSGNPENCSPYPSRDYRANDNKIYGSVTTYGCAVYTSGDIQKDLTYWHRPSQTSIMSDQNVYNAFNIISCGYIVAAIDGESLTQDNASKHWPLIDQESPPGQSIPGCSSMYVEKTGIPAANPKANVASASGSNGAASGAQGSSASVSGSGFTSTNNAVDLVNSSGSVVADIVGLSSADGKTVSFTIPTSTPPGQYTLKAGAFNSDWSNSIPFTVTTAVVTPPPALPTLSVTATPSTIAVGQTSTINWSATAAKSTYSKNLLPCTGTETINNATVAPSRAWANPTNYGTSGSFAFTPTLAGTAVFNLSCTNSVGTSNARATVQINAVATTTPVSTPVVTLTSNDTAAIPGTDNISFNWSATNSTTCTGGPVTGSSAQPSPVLASSGSSGSFTAAPSTPTTYGVSCTGPGGTGYAKPITISMITAKLTSSIATATPGQTTTLTWTSSSTSGCALTASGAGAQSAMTGSGSPTSANDAPGSYTTGPLSNDTTFTVSCSRPGHLTVGSTVTVAVPAAVIVTTPTVTLSANPTTVSPGQTTTVSWTATTSYSSYLGCTGSETLGGRSVTKPPTQWTAPAPTGTWTFAPSTTTVLTLSCVNGARQAGTAQATIQVSTPPSAPVLLAYASQGDGKVELTWADDPGVWSASYMYAEVQNADNSWTQITADPSDPTSCGTQGFVRSWCMLNGISAGAHSFRVRAYQSSTGLYSPYSNVLNATVTANTSPSQWTADVFGANSFLQSLIKNIF